MAFIRFLLIVAFVYQTSALKWKNCGKKDLPVKVKSLRVSPNPIVIKEGEKIKFSASVESSREVGATTYRLKTTVVKNPGYWYSMTLPCYGSFGTCEYKNLECEQMKSFLDVPSCPPPAGTYTLSERSMEIPSVSFPSFMLNGEYSIRAELFDQASDDMIACAEVRVTASS